MMSENHVNLVWKSVAYIFKTVLDFGTWLVLNLMNTPNILVRTKMHILDFICPKTFICLTQIY